MPVRDMHQQKPIWLERATINLERLFGQQVERDRVRGKGVDSEHVERTRWLLRQRQPRIAQMHLGIWCAFFEEAEYFPVACYFDHQRVDFEIVQNLPGIFIAGKCASAEPYNPQGRASTIEFFGTLPGQAAITASANAMRRPVTTRPAIRMMAINAVFS